MATHDNDNDARYMRRALELAERGRGWTRPNPMVGSVVVRDGEVVGEGYHERVGEAHAEVNALREAGERAAGATLYVSLEPCAHHGRTPPCADAVIQAKPARVVVAMHDPNPRVAGEGIYKLRDAGVQVDVGVLEDEARALNEVYVKYVTTGTPFVTAKCAMTLDGKIATRTGHSQWVTSEVARRVVHEMRNHADAILVGSRTVMMDDPSLTTRLEEGKIRDPIRVIVDAEDYLDTTRRVFHIESDAPTWVAAPEPRSIEGADEVIRIPRGQGGLDMQALMHELGSREVTCVMIEGGGTTHASAFSAGVVDKVIFFVAPKIIGGREAVTAVEGEGAATMDEAILLDRMAARPVGEDLLIEAYVRKS
jgi:diaminohydroxyphosphoribosylaminopyrimidine deaminase/5-amino-6-(5-phosphoribosylamino)uracil reductase